MFVLAFFAGSPSLKAGPFAKFFRELRRSLAQPEPHRTASKSSRSSSSKTRSNTSSAKRSTTSNVSEPPNSANVKPATVTAGKRDAKADLRYGIPVPGKDGFVTSPFAPNSGYVDVRGVPPGTEVKDPYSGKTFLTP